MQAHCVLKNEPKLVQVTARPSVRTEQSQLRCIDSVPLKKKKKKLAPAAPYKVLYLVASQWNSNLIYESNQSSI